MRDSGTYVVGEVPPIVLPTQVTPHLGREQAENWLLMPSGGWEIERASGLRPELRRIPLRARIPGLGAEEGPLQKLNGPSRENLDWEFFGSDGRVLGGSVCDNLATALHPFGCNLHDPFTGSHEV